MTETKEKKVLIDLGTVLIREYDNLNVQIEAFEEVLNPINNTTTSKWRFKGYSNSIFNALGLIVQNELLIDKKALTSLENHLKQVREIHEKITAALTAALKGAK